ncbi:response regulator transcription factor [Uliginosibacterium sp. H1]|uniref:response regulator transcription factor n=1 Tax=Uliginosibacterium sp. H1 TaxID=3114757 RepID=UPI002E19AFE4|nr:response regulator [Uliginosibacterium sp. H1]
MNQTAPTIDAAVPAANAGKPARVVVRVVDDDPSFRTAIQRLLRSAGFEVSTYASVAEVLLDAQQTPGCFLLDMDLPDASGLELQRALSHWQDPPPVVFLSGMSDVPSTATAMKAGAFDFLAKPVEGSVLTGVIEAALVRDSELRSRRQSWLQLQARYAQLSDRERDVMRMVVEGVLNRDIAEALDMAERTVKAHRAQVMDKMGAHTLPDLVRMAERLGRPDYYQ